MKKWAVNRDCRARRVRAGRAGLALRLRACDDAPSPTGEVAIARAWNGEWLLFARRGAPMTEQSIRAAARGRMMLLATAYDGEALQRACDHHLDAQVLERQGIAAADRGTYEMNFTATAAEVSRSSANRPLAAAERGIEGPRG